MSHCPAVLPQRIIGYVYNKRRYIHNVINTSWQLLVASIPSANTALRMRLWRGVRGAGAATLRDGVWLLPSPASDAFRSIAEEVQAVGGTVEVLTLSVADEAQDGRFRSLFDREQDFSRLLEEAASLREHLAREGGGARQVGRLRRELHQLVAIDFFPGEGQAAAKAAVLDLERALSPNEPATASGEIPRLDSANYQGRIWATRRHLWVDRLASAWLIQHFIDAKASFLWLKRPQDCPDHALGFDFDGAEFTHVGERVSFETLLASFGLEGDVALMRLARIVHALDVGGTAAESAGLETLLRGMKVRLQDDDDALLAEAGRVLDDFYHAFREELPTS